MISIEDITDQQLGSLRDVFGPCSLNYECVSIADLREDLFSRLHESGHRLVTLEQLSRGDVVSWFNTQLAIERIYAERAYDFVERSAEQIEAHDREDAEFVAGIRTRFAAWLDANVPAEDC